MNEQDRGRRPSGGRSMTERERRLREIRRKKRRQRAIRNRIIFGVVLLILLILIVLAVKAIAGAIGGSGSNAANTTPAADISSSTADETSATEETSAADETAQAASDLLSQAQLLAASYDYDGAIALSQTIPGYESDAQVTAAIDEWEQTKTTLVEVDIETIPHVFYHSLIVDPSKAFHNDEARATDYNQVMTTVDEFNKITQEMYNRGYVLVKIHDMAQNVDGTMQKGKILLPADKKPFVLSIDDVSYYEYMTGDGFATKIVIGDDGYPTCEMQMDDGSVQTGGFDVVPLLEAFIKEHPDFSYKGARGIIALTGYDGILGYRTAPKYGDPSTPEYQANDWYKDINVEQERADATAVVARMKEVGWEFATHSWGHKDMGEASYDNMVADMEKWLDQVNPLLGGDTDIVIFPKGTDIGSWRGYDDNDKFEYLKSVGFDYYCNVDANQPWVQFDSRYLRQARINFDGYEMYYCQDKLAPFFDADSVFDSSRPTPVKKM